jgi:hypothetical protein
MILGSLYLYFDPFKVLYDYNSFYETNAVTLDRDYVSTETFIKNNKKINYNSFIFGNSRSIFYQVSDWKRYLNNNAICFHFDASGESLWALGKKAEYIDKIGNNIDNVLLILDYATLNQDKPKSGHLGIISPALVENSNIIEFHKTFFSAFLAPNFLYAFLDYKISGKIKSYMKKGFLLDDRPLDYDLITNEERFDYFENLIKENENTYYTQQRLSVFYPRNTASQQFSPKCIYDSQKNILENIASIIKKHNTNLKVIISPVYDQLKLDNSDLEYLKNTFGKENVFDFSGINKFTNDYRNYYEPNHYRPHVAREILNIIYRK